ncbi:nitrous oxide reductase accessory protein NosL [Aquicoccus sp.]|uniref:nitrous oxide reductase accessory protein NosL n=1 Tax=Aquicoccus sp. TaxID=2055851 RepID=UPI0035636616
MKRIVLLAVLALTACKQEAEAPPDPVTMTAEAVGHFCQMDLLEHPGPKAQVHLDGMPHPLFFSQVRDAEAYRRMPEQSHAISAIYVSDMAVAPDWDDPGKDNWIAADEAVYVVGAAIAGGMGAQEFVPFSDRAAARDFADRHGGVLMELADIPDDRVFAPENAPETAPSGDDDSDYLDRLRAITNTSGG